MARKEAIGDVDAAFEALGPLGKYNLIQFFIQFVLMWTLSFQAYSMVFTGSLNPFRCRPSELDDFNASFLEDQLSPEYDSSCTLTLRTSNETSSNSLSSKLESLSCNSHELEYELSKDMYFTSEFDLECERDFLKAMTQTVYAVGYCVGSFIGPYFTDKYGRKRVAILSGCLCGVVSLAMALSVNYTMFTVTKFFIGFGGSILMTPVASSCMEALVTRHRAMMFGVLGALNWTVGMLLLTPMAYLLRHYSWRVLQYAISAFYLFIIVKFFVMDETLRWLAANGRKKQAVAVLERASKMNKKDFKIVKNAFFGMTNSEENGKSSEQNGIATIEIDMKSLGRKSSTFSYSEPVQDKENLKIMDLVRDPMLRLHSAFVLIGCLFCNLAYLGLILMSSALVGNLYLNFFIQGVAEIPQAIASYFYLDNIGRRGMISIFSIIAGISLLIMAALRSLAPEQEVFITVLSIVGKFGITGSFNVVFTMVSELFPTNLRNTGLGLANLGGGIGGMLAPQAELFFKVAVYGPGLVFGSTSLLLGLSTYFLPETTRHRLPQTLAEMKLWKKKNVVAVQEIVTENGNKNMP